MDGKPTYQTDEDGYPTPAGMLEMLTEMRRSMPNGREQNNMSYAIGYIRHALGLVVEEE
jgi:hypothetical protein